MSETDHQLIEESLKGRSESFGRLVQRYQDRLVNSFWFMLGSAEDAHDVAQDAFLQAFTKLSSFRGESSFYSWLYRIALNSAVDLIRKKKSIQSLDRESSTTPPETRHNSSPDFRLQQQEHQKIVWTALNQLSEEFRQALVLKEIEGLKYEEISAILSCPIGTVRSRIHRARMELRQHLKPYMN